MRQRDIVDELIEMGWGVEDLFFALIERKK